MPDVEIGVMVRDAVTGRGVRGSVMVRNTYRVEEDDLEVGRQRDRQEKERVISQVASTDETGLARLSFLRRGEVEIRAAAKGYLPLREPVKGQVLGDEEQSFEVRLEPLGETVTLRLLLPDGSPASGAEALLTDSLGAGAILIATRADGKGSLDLPRQQAGFLLVKHPSAAFLMREWRPRDDESEVDWTLPPTAGLPLTVRVQDASGKGASAQAELALWVEGRRLSGTALAWLTGAGTGTDSNGYWIGKNLPRGPVEVLAWSLRVREEATAGALDSLATGVHRAEAALVRHAGVAGERQRCRRRARPAAGHRRELGTP